MSTILVFGGYGGFGARLSRRLAAAGHDVVVAGRRLARAEAFCAAHPPCRPLQADRNGAVAPLLEAALVKLRANGELGRIYTRWSRLR